MNDIPTTKLLDEEARLAAEKRALVSFVILEIEKLLINHDLTMGDWAEIADALNTRSVKYFSQIKIKTIKENYGKI